MCSWCLTEITVSSSVSAGGRGVCVRGRSLSQLPLTVTFRTSEPDWSLYAANAEQECRHCTERSGERRLSGATLRVISPRSRSAQRPRTNGPSFLHAKLGIGHLYSHDYASGALTLHWQETTWSSGVVGHPCQTQHSLSLSDIFPQR